MQNKVGRVDYRLVIIGSMLPDIIDKPVWFLAGRDASLSGRDFAHTLLFNLTLFAGGMFLLRYRKSGLFVLSVASLTHLVFDQMWRNLPTLFWPFAGPLRERETTDWLSNLLSALFSKPDVYVPELIGLAVVLFFGYKLVSKKRITQFLQKGAID
ncbi:MAG: metal-dependent hydrolase [Chloroflexi bacterium]|nr:metal-dependent hydrolase [Chloroflexota bacterium]MBI4267283.1 metal-dependent hydrolase [Chloroflexota bacterium]